MTWHALTVNASDGLKVRITFHEFNFTDFEYLEIGDGVVVDDDTRLVNFSGATLPSNVTSVSNGAWIKIKSPCGTMSPDLNITITGVRQSSK